MRYSVVLFDLDGTLVDTNHLIVHSFQHTLREKLGLEVTAADLHQYFGEPLVATMARFAPDRAQELTDFYRVFNLANHDALIREFVGVFDTVSALRQSGVRLAVVTSKKRDLALRGLRVSGLAPLFDAVVGMDETEKHKPDPEPALLALERLGAAPGHHVLMVGDSQYDMLCGKNAGLHTAAVAWTVQEREELAFTQPDHWIEAPADLVHLVLGR